MEEAGGITTSTAWKGRFPGGAGHLGVNVGHPQLGKNVGCEPVEQHHFESHGGLGYNGHCLNSEADETATASFSDRGAPGETLVGAVA